MAPPVSPTPEPDDGDLGEHGLITLVGLLFECTNGLQQRLKDNMRRDSGMALSTFEVLIRLLRSPDHRVPLADLGQELAITTGGVTRLIDRMEEQKLVRRVRSRTDRRAIYAELTPSGRRAVLAALPAHTQDLESVFAVLTLRQRRQLEDALRALRPAVCGSAYRQ